MHVSCGYSELLMIVLSWGHYEHFSKYSKIEIYIMNKYLIAMLVLI
jgi:hypothetical protein